MGKLPPASHFQEQCAYKLESRPAHETSEQHYDNPTESFGREDLKGGRDVAVTSNLNTEADASSDVDEDMDGNDFNSEFALTRCTALSQQEEIEESSLNDEDIVPLPSKLKKQQAFFRHKEEQRRLGRHNQLKSIH